MVFAKPLILGRHNRMDEVRRHLPEPDFDALLLENREGQRVVAIVDDGRLIHLAYPAQVQQTLIRGALRVRVALPGTTSNSPGQVDAPPHAVTLSDLSVSGAQLETGLSLGESGERFTLTFKFVVQPNNYEVKLTAAAQIQSVRKIRKGNAQEEMFSLGVRFNKLHATEGLLLQSYIQQVLLSDRSRVV